MAGENPKLKITVNDAIGLNSLFVEVINNSGCLSGKISYWLGKFKGELDKIEKDYNKVQKALFKEHSSPAKSDGPETVNKQGNKVLSFRKGDPVIEDGTENKKLYNEKLDAALEVEEEITLSYQFEVSDFEYKNGKETVCFLSPLMITLMGDLIKAPK